MSYARPLPWSSRTLSPALRRLAAWWKGGTQTWVELRCERFESLNRLYGQGSDKHALRILGRVLGEQGEIRQVDDGCYQVIFCNRGRAEVEKVMKELGERFDREMTRAGYRCPIRFGQRPIADSAHFAYLN